MLKPNTFKNAEKPLAMADKFYSMREYEFAWSEAARKLDETYNLLRDIVDAPVSSNVKRDSD